MKMQHVEDLIKKTESYDQQYEVLNELGRGRFAVVKKCTCKKTGKNYAAKVIKKSRTNSHGRSGREQLLLEIDILKQSNHPKMVRLYDVFETRGEMQLILEFAAGGDLHRHCIEGDVARTEKEICYLIRQIVEAVRYLHDQEIVHLDLKPDNILLANQGGVFPEIRLIDFGLSRRLNVPYSQFDIVGTPEYVAPEVLAYEPIDYGSDMWSVGVVTYVLLSGISPFAGDDVMETYSNIGMVEYDFDCEEFDDISDHAIDFIEKLLVRQPKKRMTAREALEHPWLKQLEEGLTARDVIQAQHVQMEKPEDVVITPFGEDEYPSSSESETPLEKSTEILADQTADGEHETGTKEDGKTEENVNEIKTSDVTVIETSDVTVIETSNVTEIETSDVTVIETSDVTEIETSDVTVIETSNVTDKMGSVNEDLNTAEKTNDERFVKTETQHDDANDRFVETVKKEENSAENAKSEEEKDIEEISVNEKKEEITQQEIIEPKKEKKEVKKEVEKDYKQLVDVSTEQSETSKRVGTKTPANSDVDLPAVKERTSPDEKKAAAVASTIDSKSSIKKATPSKSVTLGMPKLTALEKRKQAFELAAKADTVKGNRTPNRFDKPASGKSSTSGSTSNTPSRAESPTKATGENSRNSSNKSSAENSPIIRRKEEDGPRATSPAVSSPSVGSSARLRKEDSGREGAKSPAGRTNLHNSSVRGKIPGGIAAKMAGKFSHMGNSSPARSSPKPVYTKRSSIEKTSKPFSPTDNTTDKKEILKNSSLDDSSKKDSPKASRTSVKDKESPRIASKISHSSKTEVAAETKESPKVGASIIADNNASSPVTEEKIPNDNNKETPNECDIKNKTTNKIEPATAAKNIRVSMTLGGSVSASGKKLNVGRLISSASKLQQEELAENGEVEERDQDVSEPPSMQIEMTKGGSAKMKLGLGRPSKNGDEAHAPKLKELRGKSSSISRRRADSSPNSPRKNYRRLYVTKVRNSKVYDPDFNIMSTEAAKIMQRVDNDVLQVELRLTSTDLKLLP